LRIEPLSSWLVHISSGWMSWLSFLISRWDLLISINAIHILSNYLILTSQRLLLSLLLRSQSTTSASNVSTVLLSVVRFLTVHVTVESVLMWAINAHLTLAHVLSILVKRFIAISSCLLSHGLLLAREIHSFLFLCFTWLSIWFGKSGWLVGYAVLEEDTLFIWSVCFFCIVVIVAERWTSILSCSTWAHSIIVFSVKSSSDTWFMHLVPWIIWLILGFCNVLLELRVILILYRDLLNVLGRLIVVWV
jgi:hypothetical protein